jgi:thermostable 8-oxoguanine DNA glycosylase
MTEQQLEQLNAFLSRYEERVAKNRAAFKVEAHVHLDDMEVLLKLARTGLAARTLVAKRVAARGVGQ